jgi:hypothetical protein
VDLVCLRPAGCWRAGWGGLGAHWPGEVRRPFLGIAARGEDLEPDVANEAKHPPRHPGAGGGGGLAGADGLQREDLLVG